MVQLHANQSTGCAEEALNKVFLTKPPSGSAFSQARDRVSWRYFEWVFEHTATHFCEKNRPLFKGYYLTAIDGDQYLIERNKHTLNAGYSGQKCGKNHESYGLKMYLAFGIDMISGAPLGISISTNPNELALGLESTKKIHKLQSLFNKSGLDTIKHIFTYDRLYFCRDLIDLHKFQRTGFVVRCKKNGTFSEIKDFIESGKKEVTTEINSIKIKLIKAMHKNTTYYYATNIFDEEMTNDDISWIYLRRWEIETTNSHGVNIAKIEHFHSIKPNGIIQEIFASFWAILITKTNRVHLQQTKEDFRQQTYRRQNSKRVYNELLNNLTDLFSDKSNKILDQICELAKLTTRKITRLGRVFERIRSYRRNKKYRYRQAVPIPIV